jgi:hypothetical protein
MEMERKMQKMLQQTLANQEKANVYPEQIKTDRKVDQAKPKANQED